MQYEFAECERLVSGDGGGGGHKEEEVPYAERRMSFMCL
jgi:hypothetical protein